MAKKKPEVAAAAAVVAAAPATPGEATVVTAPALVVPPAAAPAPKPEKPAKIVQNGITRPKDGTATGRVWAIADELSAAAQAPTERKPVLDKAVAEGINIATAATQYVKWCRFYGVEKAKPVAAAPAPAAPAQPDLTPSQVFQAQPMAQAMAAATPPDVTITPAA